MVLNEDQVADKVSDIFIWCKPCTLASAQTAGSKYHNHWELVWVRDRYIGQLRRVIDGLTSSPPKWSKSAAEKFHRLGVIAFPELTGSPIGNMDPEWDRYQHEDRDEE